jgi:RNA polymerase sigma factor (sigma-70 family)
MKLRKNHASREVSIDRSVETSELCSEHQSSDVSPNPEERCTKSEREAILRDAIAKLRPRIRKALEIHKLQERSLEETADVLGTSVAAVKARVFHARAAAAIPASVDLGKSRASFTPGSIKVQQAERRY